MLAWNVYYGNFNDRKIETYNIFDHYSFCKECEMAAKRRGVTKEEFAEAVRKSLMYYFWSKCEWEIIVSHWPPNERLKDRKIDVYEQVMMNWDVFIDWLWTNRKELG